MTARSTPVGDGNANAVGGFDSRASGPDELERLHEEWQESVRRGRPDRFARQKAYLAAKARTEP